VTSRVGLTLAIRYHQHPKSVNFSDAYVGHNWAVSIRDVICVEMVSGFGFWVSGFGFQVSGFGFRILGVGVRVSGSGYRSRESRGGCSSGSRKSMPSACRNLISQKVFIKSFGKSQFPHKSVNLSCIITNIKDQLTDLRGN